MANQVFDNYKNEMERIHVETAHDQHKVEFQEMCAKMIDAAKEDMRREFEYKETKSEDRKKRREKVKVEMDIKDVHQQLKKAFNNLLN